MKGRVLLLAAVVASAGCLGFGEEDTDTDDVDTQDLDDDDVEPELNESANETEWAIETYEGSISGNFLFAPTPPSEGQSFTFNAEDGIDELHINVTTEGGELRILVSGPDCDFGSPCEEETTTEGGEGQYVNASAEPGEWTVRFFADETAAHDVTYEAVVAQAAIVPADA